MLIFEQVVVNTILEKQKTTELLLDLLGYPTSHTVYEWNVNSERKMLGHMVSTNNYVNC